KVVVADLFFTDDRFLRPAADLVVECEGGLPIALVEAGIFDQLGEQLLAVRTGRLADFSDKIPPRIPIAQGTGDFLCVKPVEQGGGLGQSLAALVIIPAYATRTSTFRPR